jgi:hypothetical protein
MGVEMSDVSSWIGLTAVGPDGDKVGKINDVYADDDTGRPECVAVTTGMFGTRVSFVPLAGAAPSGGETRVAYPKDQVKDAPQVEADGHLSRTTSGGRRQGRELSGEEHEVVLHAEEVDVTTRVVPKERARLEVETVTEQVAVSEEVRKEHRVRAPLRRLLARPRHRYPETSSASKYDASDIVGKVVFYALFRIGLQLAFGVFGPNPVRDVIRGVIAYLPKVIAALLIVVIGSAVAAAPRQRYCDQRGSTWAGRGSGTCVRRCRGLPGAVRGARAGPSPAPWRGTSPSDVIDLRSRTRTAQRTSS